MTGRTKARAAKRLWIPLRLPMSVYTILHNHVDLEERISNGLLQLIGSEARYQVETIIDGGCCSWQRMRAWRRTRSGRALGCPRDSAGDKPPWQIQRLDRHNALPASHHQTERDTRLHFMMIERLGGSRNTYQFWKGAKTPNEPSENRRSAQGGRVAPSCR